MPLHDLTFLDVGKPWPPESEKPRLDEYRANIDIIEGDHLNVFTKLKAFLDAEPADDKLPVFIDTADTAQKTTTSLVLGNAPEIMASDEGGAKAEACARIVRDTRFVEVSKKVLEDMMPCGVGIFTIGAKDSRLVIRSAPPENWFPVSQRGDPQNITNHVIAWTFEEPGENGAIPKKYLFAEIYSLTGKGLCAVEHRLYSMKSAGAEEGDKIGEALDLGAFPEFENLAPVTETGAEGFLVVPVFNRPSSRHPYGRPDMNRLTRENIEAVEDILTRQRDALQRFTHPDISAPRSAFVFDESRKREVFRSGEAHMLKKDDPPISPIVWNIPSEAVEAMVTRLLDQIYEALELSPQLVSTTKEGGEAESGRALRFRLIPTLAKVDRIRDALDGGGYAGGIPLVLSLASQLEAALPEPAEGAAPFEPSEVRVEWGDNLPEDKDAEVERDVKLYQNEMISLERYLKLQGLPDDAVKEELARLRKAGEEKRGSLL